MFWKMYRTFNKLCISIICFLLVLLKYIYTKNFENFQPKKPQTFNEPHDLKISKSPEPPSNLMIIIFQIAN